MKIQDPALLQCSLLSFNSMRLLFQLTIPKFNLVVCDNKDNARLFISLFYSRRRKEFKTLRLFAVQNNHHESYIAYDLNDRDELRYVQQAVAGKTIDQIVLFNTTITTEVEWNSFESTICGYFVDYIANPF